MKRYRQLALALVLQVLGAGGALLVSAQTWQRLTSAREGPFPDVHVAMTGRDVDSAVTALALVALAGVVAVLATRGWWRRLVGAVVALAGAFTVVRAVLSSGAVSNRRALDFIADHRQTVTTPAGARVHVQVLTAWPVLSAVCGVLVLVAGLFVAVRGGRWQGMSARYERGPDPAGTNPDATPVTPTRTTGTTAEEESARSDKAAATMWSALDRGDDPTA